jgi:GT2 family glycosyltransferase
MRLVVIIPTFGRRQQLTRMLRHLENQHRLPDEVVVSAPDTTHVDTPGVTKFPVTYLFGATGSSAQRNNALTEALPKSDAVVFFDDDFVPADNYLQLVEHAFEENSDWAVVMGRPLHDGANNAGFTFEQGLALLRDAHSLSRSTADVVEHLGAYGCNMSARSRCIGDLRFDERLVLYGWQEDVDFTSQLRNHGRIIELKAMTGVHLGIKSGRVSGLRFGYSQVANPLYLIQKGTVPATFALRLMARNILANAMKSIWPEEYIDRRGRLKGNLLAGFHWVKGQVEPEHILKL